MTVGLAFYYFNNQDIDIAVIEVGMGGRLDSTNIIDPEISVITNIGLDHTKFLGNSLREIALEKAGVIKQGKTIVIGESQSEIADIFIEKAKGLKSNIIFADQQKKIEFSTDLKGSYQRKNIQTAMSVIYELQKSEWNINDDSIKSGLLNVQLNTGLAGRWTILNQNPLTICDTAHNVEGLSIVLKDLLLLDYSKLHFVIGVVEDKDLSSIIDLFPIEANYYFCKPSIPRGLDAKILKDKFCSKNRMGSVYSSVDEAYKMSLSLAKKKDVVYVGGSTFVVAEIL
jgi:dihydrofolate synthase/folylpolyglutamate synthase